MTVLPTHPLLIQDVMIRKVVQDFTLSNGIVLPAGTLVSLPMYATYRDALIYNNVGKLDRFRFSRLREERDAEDEVLGTKLLPPAWRISCGVSGNTSGVLGPLFVSRKYADIPSQSWPLFAVVELKVMLLHIVMNYKVKMERAICRFVRHVWLYSRTAKVLFRCFGH
jgi:hypothetical protein